MKPFRKNVALAVDGGGIRGIIVTRALSILEQNLGQSIQQIFRLAAGTSTGSIISAALGAGITARALTGLYLELGPQVFKPTLRSHLFPITRYRYPGELLQSLLYRYFGNRTMGDFWSSTPQTDVVITCFDLLTNHTRFIKPWKEEYASWSVVKAVQASCTVPTYFPVVEGRYVDGGVGSYANPCYLAAYEAIYCLNWDPAETTLVSLGTGREPHSFDPSRANNLFAWEWVAPLLGAFLQSADDQQVHLVSNFFQQVDFRRFQVALERPIPMDDASDMNELLSYGEELGRMLMMDVYDPALFSTPTLPHST